jgi:flagellin
MPITIGANISSLRAQNQLSKATDALGNTYARLSSGLRINKASDDAAGLAISESLKTDTRVFNQGIRNINDGLSVLNIAQGALQELSNISQRQIELATQAANGVYSTRQRDALETEANALVNEYNRIIASTSFNGTNILSGSYRDGLRIQAGYGLDGSISASLGNLLARNVGSGTFASSLNFTAVRTGVDVVYDVNGDGRDDIVKWSGGYVDTYLNNGDGTFAYRQNTISSFVNPTVFQDIDGDGIRDAISQHTATDSIYIARGNANGSFASSITIAAGTFGDIQNNDQIHIGDFDGNGKLDIMTMSFNSNIIRISSQNANGTFAAAQTAYTLPGGTFYNIAVGDFNGDGRDDIVLGGEPGGVTATNTRILLSNGNGTFSVGASIANSSRNLSVADFNGDGILDIVAGHSFFETTSRVFLGNGDGTFRISATIVDGVGTYAGNSISDFNNDGNTDILFTEASGTRIAYGNGNGTFSLGSLLTPTSVLIGDFNGDGVTDINDNGSTSSVIFYQDTTKNAGIKRMELSTAEYAREELSTIQATMQRIALEIGSIGSLMSRFTVARNNLEISSQNYQAANSRITDIDVAEESSVLIATRIRQQAAASILSQANLQPQLALQLLQ